MNLRAVCAYGSPVKDQIAELKKGAEFTVCTPGRMIDLLTANSGRVTNLQRITYMVLESQVMKSAQRIRSMKPNNVVSALTCGCRPTARLRSLSYPG
jgi:hypothetical protein